MSCHGVPLTGSQGNGPALKGGAFLAHWDKDTVGSLFVKIRDTMPLNNAGTITDEVKLEIFAYLLESYGPLPAFLVTWSQWIATLVANAAVSIARTL